MELSVSYQKQTGTLFPTTVYGVAMSDEYTPLIDRERGSKPRVHEELTQTARERLTVVTEDTSESAKAESIRFLMSKVGRTPVIEHLPTDAADDDIDGSVVHRHLIEAGDTIHVLTYLESLIKEHNLKRHRSRLADFRMGSKSMDLLSEENKIVFDSTKDLISGIRDVLITEGILWEVKLAGPGGIIQFVPLESEAMKEMDEKVRAFSEEEPWESALRGYNDAFERYLEGDFDEVLVKKLYNSIEQVLQTICIDLEGWTDNQDRSHSYYLELLNEHEVYKANGITAPELNQLLDSLEKLVSKVGNDRKQRHAYHDRAYCTLLIHQVGAYLYFIISRYDEYKT